MPNSCTVDLQPSVLARLFGVTLALHSAACVLKESPVASRIIDASRQVDEVITDLRAGAYDSVPPDEQPAVAERDHVRWLVAALCPVLAFEPEVTVVCTDPGHERDTLTGTLVLDVAAVISEGLTNIAGHACAGAAAVVLGLGRAHVSVEIVDDGVGMPLERRGPGLQDLERRARRRNGTFDVRSGVAGGTHLSWTVPVTIPQRPAGPTDPDSGPTPASARTRSSRRAASPMGAVASTSRSAEIA